jgi:carbon storage regulator CsrA
VLVLSRKPGEEVIIAGSVRITILAAKGDRVRIGIVAPSSVKVRRQEIAARGPGEPDDVPRPRLRTNRSVSDGPRGPK